MQTMCNTGGVHWILIAWRTRNSNAHTTHMRRIGIHQFSNEFLCAFV